MGKSVALFYTLVCGVADWDQIEMIKGEDE